MSEPAGSTVTVSRMVPAASRRGRIGRSIWLTSRRVSERASERAAYGTVMVVPSPVALTVNVPAAAFGVYVYVAPQAGVPPCHENGLALWLCSAWATALPERGPTP